MLESYTYRASEHLAKTFLPSWRISQVHNLDVFEKVGFPVRINSIRELGQIIDTMQEHRFERYMSELDGLSSDEYASVLAACVELVWFQLTYLPHRPPLFPVSTLLSAFAIYKKIRGADANFRSVLEIGPGCGYVSLFLKNHETLQNYSQIEACESFYILQNLLNLHCFGPRFDERALPPDSTNALDYYAQSRPDFEKSAVVRIKQLAPLCTHYPWWRIGEIVSNERQFDTVTSNANLLEFSPPALNDYLALVQQALKPDGIFLVQCTGFELNGSLPGLLDKLYAEKFAPLMFLKENKPASFPGANTVESSLLRGILPKISCATNNAVFVRPGHPLFDKYYRSQNFHTDFVSDESLVRSMFFERPAVRKIYTMAEFLDDTEVAVSQRLGRNPN